MNTQNKTGYPSIDKPQYKYYRKSPVRNIEAVHSFYELVFCPNSNHMQTNAIEYLGRNWTFAEVKEKVDQTASAFFHAGLRKGDVVLIGISNCPEVLSCLLGLNRIGVVSKWFDVRASEKDIQEYANDSKCRFLIAFDMLIPKIEKIIDQTYLEKVIIVEPVSSLSIPIQLAYKLKNHTLFRQLSQLNVKFVDFNKFVKQSQTTKNVDCPVFDEEMPAIMIQSSGTTGKPKVIVHSTYSAIASTRKLAYSDLPIEPNKILLDLLPPWIAYALGQAILYPLAMGCKVILCPTFEPDAIMEYIGKFTVSLAAPFHYRYLNDHFETLSDRKKKRFFEMVDGFVSGGDKITIEENRIFERVFRAPLVNGYGNNEGWGCLTVNSAKHNKYGSVGIPKYGETVISYDNDNEIELSFGSSGEICALADTAFLYYESNAEATHAVKKIHPDGKTWLHTGDLGYVDEDGFVFLQGRLRRVIVRAAFKISAYTIEDKISEHPAVKECVAVEVNDKEEEHVPMAYIVLKNSNEMNKQNVCDSIIDKCKNELKAYEVPKYFRFVESLPYTQNGKYNFRLLEEQGNEYVKFPKERLESNSLM